MKVGLIGHRGAGKTTIFNMLTGLQAQVGVYGGKEEVHLGVIKVPDVRIDKLSRIYKPKKTTYPEIRFTDFPPSEGEENLKSNNSLITQMREVDAIALVLRDFESGADPLKELNDLLTDMILADLTVVENRRARLKKEKARPLEEAVLERCAKTLENEESLRNLTFNADEENLLSGFGFLSRKPVLVLFNQADDRAGQPLAVPYQEELKRRGQGGNGSRTARRGRPPGVLERNRHQRAGERPVYPYVLRPFEFDQFSDHGRRRSPRMDGHAGNQR